MLQGYWGAERLPLVGLPAKALSVVRLCQAALRKGSKLKVGASYEAKSDFLPMTR